VAASGDSWSVRWRPG